MRHPIKAFHTNCIKQPLISIQGLFNIIKCLYLFDMTTFQIWKKLSFHKDIIKLTDLYLSLPLKNEYRIPQLLCLAHISSFVWHVYSSGPNNSVVLNKRVGGTFCSLFIGENAGFQENLESYQVKKCMLVGFFCVNKQACGHAYQGHQSKGTKAVG